MSGSRPSVGSSRIASSGSCWSAWTTPIFGACRASSRGPSAAGPMRALQLAELGAPKRLAALEVDEVVGDLLPGEGVGEGNAAGEVAGPTPDLDRIH